ncbi:MAG: 50S ribosomal protein L22 [Candidatus Spechtbacterales bacterium]
MAEYKAKLSYLKISPRKVRLVADLVRNQNIEEARMQLKYSNKRASVSLLKLLNSAVSNAKDVTEGINESNLRIKEIRVDEGPMLKRYMPVARGTVHEIQKKTSHVTLILSEKELKKQQETNNKRQAKSERKPSESEKVKTQNTKTQGKSKKQNIAKGDN